MPIDAERCVDVRATPNFEGQDGGPCARALWPAVTSLTSEKRYLPELAQSADIATVTGTSLLLIRGRHPSTTLVMQALAVRYGSDPGRWRCVRDAAGRIQPADGTLPCAAYCSISRADDMQIVAVGDAPLGVDAETLPRIALNARSDDAWLSRGDRAFLSGRPPGETGELAARWVLREAFGKALGLGLAMPLAQLDFVRTADGEIYLQGRTSLRPDCRFGLYQRDSGVIAIAMLRRKQSESGILGSGPIDVSVTI